jgi:hypothetical protein
MSTFASLIVSGMGLARITLGLAPFIAAGPTARLLGFPAHHDTATARLMGRFFGVRDIGLGILAFYAVKHPELASFIFLFQALMDGGDLAAISIPLIKRQGIDRGAALAALFALTGGLSWLFVWLIAR